MEQLKVFRTWFAPARQNLNGAYLGELPASAKLIESFTAHPHIPRPSDNNHSSLQRFLLNGEIEQIHAVGQKKKEFPVRRFKGAKWFGLESKVEIQSFFLSDFLNPQCTTVNIFKHGFRNFSRGMKFFKRSWQRTDASFFARLQ